MMRSTVLTIVLLIFVGLVACQPVEVKRADDVEAANIAIVDGFFDALVVQKDAEEVGKYLADDFISNASNIEGKQGMMDFATWQAENIPDGGIVEVFHTVAKGDLVIKHYTYGNDPEVGADLLIADFFRLEDGLIVEYWDVVTPIGEEE